MSFLIINMSDKYTKALQTNQYEHVCIIEIMFLKFMQPNNYFYVIFYMLNLQPKITKINFKRKLKKE